MYIENKSTKRKSKKICKTLQEFLLKLPLEIKNILNRYNTLITITNIKNDLQYETECVGCYLMEFNKNKPIAHIYISETNDINKVANVLSHEIGHLLDQVLGCFYNKVNISKENIKNFPLSLTHDEIVLFIKKESDFFTQIKRTISTEIDLLIEKYDLQEEFANCVAQVLTNTSKSRFPVTKNTLAEVFSEFNKDNFNVFKIPLVAVL